MCCITFHRVQELCQHGGGAEISVPNKHRLWFLWTLNITESNAPHNSKTDASIGSCAAQCSTEFKSCVNTGGGAEISVPNKHRLWFLWTLNITKSNAPHNSKTDARIMCCTTFHRVQELCEHGGGAEISVPNKT